VNPVTQEVDIVTGAEKHQMNQALGEDLAGVRPQIPIDYNLGHLTLSDTMLTYIDAHDILHPLKPLADQIFGTANLDKRAIAGYKMKIKRIIIRIKMDLDEDNPTEHHVLRVAETYLNSYVESCLDGYRGKLATEIRRVFKQEREDPNRRRWGL